MALAAFTTGGTFSDRRGGSAVGAIKSALLGDLNTDEPGAATVRAEFVDVGAVLLRLETGWLFSETGNSCRRTGSEPD